jgi:type III restriction enzyme
MNQFLDAAPDVDSFAKNQGPQALRVDALSPEGIRTLYTPDFVVRRDSGDYFVAETKGTGFARDPAVAAKAKAAQEWCKAASTKACGWEYLYVPQKQFEAFTGDTVAELAAACKPALAKLVKDVQSPQMILDIEGAEAQAQLSAFVEPRAFNDLDSGDQYAIRQAVQLFEFMAAKPDPLFAPVFQPLLGRIDDAAEQVLLHELLASVPSETAAQDEFFQAESKFLGERVRSLKRLLVTRSPLMPTGLLLFCIEYASSTKPAEPGVLELVKQRFAELHGSELETQLRSQYEFRNTYVAHEKYEPLQSVEAARGALRTWIDALRSLRESADVAAATTT